MGAEKSPRTSLHPSSTAIVLVAETTEALSFSASYSVFVIHQTPMYFYPSFLGFPELRNRLRNGWLYERFASPTLFLPLTAILLSR